MKINAGQLDRRLTLLSARSGSPNISLTRVAAGAPAIEPNDTSGSSLMFFAAGAGASDDAGSYDDAGNEQDEFGQVITSFRQIASLYAQRLELRTQDAARAGGRDTYSTARYLIRYRPDITTAMRVQIDDTEFDIVAIDQPDRRQTMVLTLEERL
ncbi:phage head closure protein [Sphingomonas sanguinis]|uniref:phage head closure protein n=1 Tax=Sphingomonas sanguinis TaxID=33051 RepID=UPI00301886D9